MLGQNNWRYQIDTEWGDAKRRNTEFESSQSSGFENIAPENAHALVFCDDNLLLVTDHPDHNVIEYDGNGNIVDAWGTQWPGAHGIKKTQEEGETFLFIVDSGWIVNRHWDGVTLDDWGGKYNKMIAQGGSIAKTDRHGRVLFTIGHPQTVGAYEPGMPFNPTDVTIADNGDIFVVDGYGSDYILKYNRDGKFIASFGKNNADSRGNIVNGHGITIDKRGDEPLLLVSSRGEHALLWYTLNGEFVRRLDVPGAFIHSPVFNGEHMIAAACWTGDKDDPKLNSGVVCIFDEHDELVSVLGGPLPEKGQLVRADNQCFHHCHGLEQDEQGNLYLAQWRANHAHPIRLLKVD